MLEAMSEKWNKFIQDKLLWNDLIDGVLLLTNNLEPVYTFGELCDIPENQFHQFERIFQWDLLSEFDRNCVLANGFQLDVGLRTLKFVVRQRQDHSAYAITKANAMGLVVVNLPFGILVASHSYPVTSAVASQHVEDVCRVLRS